MRKWLPLFALALTACGAASDTDNSNLLSSSSAALNSVSFEEPQDQSTLNVIQGDEIRVYLQRDPSGEFAWKQMNRDMLLGDPIRFDAPGRSRSAFFWGGRNYVAPSLGAHQIQLGYFSILKKAPVRVLNLTINVVSPRSSGSAGRSLVDSPNATNVTAQNINIKKYGQGAAIEILWMASSTDHVLVYDIGREVSGDWKIRVADYDQATSAARPSPGNVLNTIEVPYSSLTLARIQVVNRDGSALTTARFNPW